MAFRLATESCEKSVPVPTDYRGGVLHRNAPSLHSKWVLNIQNKGDDYCFIWCILAHIHRADEHVVRTSKYALFMYELNKEGLQFPLKFSNTPKFEKPKIKRQRLGLSMPPSTATVNITSTCWLFVRDLSALVHERWTYQHRFISLRLLSVLLLGGAAARRSPPGLFRPSRRSRKNIKKFKAIGKTIPVPFVKYVDFEAFLVSAEEKSKKALPTQR